MHWFFSSSNDFLTVFILIQGRELPNIHRNLVPSLQSCVRKSLFRIFQIILWNLKVLTKSSIIVRVMRSPLKFIPKVFWPLRRYIDLIDDIKSHVINGIKSWIGFPFWNSINTTVMDRERWQNSCYCVSHFVQNGEKET